MQSRCTQLVPRNRLVSNRELHNGGAWYECQKQHKCNRCQETEPVLALPASLVSLDEGTDSANPRSTSPKRRVGSRKSTLWLAILETAVAANKGKVVSGQMPIGGTISLDIQITGPGSQLARGFLVSARPAAEVYPRLDTGESQSNSDYLHKLEVQVVSFVSQ